jgi:23S rRNA pseudouridine1911/1915/1917 synthase
VNEEAFQIEPALVGARLDVAMVSLLPALSRTRSQALIRQGDVQVNGTVASRPGLRMEAGDRVLVRLREPAPSTPTRTDPSTWSLRTATCCWSTKPAGTGRPPGRRTASFEGRWSTQPCSCSGPRALAANPPGVVHRLDKDTSGLILLAKNDLAYRSLQQEFKARTISKTYLAITDGHPPTPTGRIEAPIGRDPRYRQKMTVVAAEKGRAASTAYRTREAYRDACLLEVQPETGRTHQIRVHLAFLGCPVLGDRVYGRRTPSLDAPRQMLHAWRLRVLLPGEREPREFEAALPPDFESILSELRGRQSGA